MAALTCKGFAFLFVSMTCTPEHTPPANTYCQIAKPIYWESATPRRTKEQIDRENRKWKALCAKGKR
jgi:hypothetical protein